MRWLIYLLAIGCNGVVGALLTLPNDIFREILSYPDTERINEFAKLRLVNKRVKKEADERLEKWLKSRSPLALEAPFVPTQFRMLLAKLISSQGIFKSDQEKVLSILALQSSAINLLLLHPRLITEMRRCKGEVYFTHFIAPLLCARIEDQDRQQLALRLSNYSNLEALIALLLGFKKLDSISAVTLQRFLDNRSSDIFWQNDVNDFFALLSLLAKLFM